MCRVSLKIFHFIPRCCKCHKMFLSSVKLVEHLTTAHTETSNTMTWEQLFEESIASSLYLPEPDNSLSRAQKEHVNLPEELSEVSIAEVCCNLIACTGL